MIAVCSLKEPIGFSTAGVDHPYGVLEVSKIANCGKAGKELDIPPNTITRPSEAEKEKKKKKKQELNNLKFNNTLNCNSCF